MSEQKPMTYNEAIDEIDELDVDLLKNELRKHFGLGPAQCETVELVNEDKQNTSESFNDLVGQMESLADSLRKLSGGGES